MTSPYTLARLAWRGWQRLTARPHIKHLHAACQHPESLAKKVSQKAGESSLQLGDGEWESVKRGLLYGNGYWCCRCFCSSGPLKTHSTVEYHNKSFLWGPAKLAVLECHGLLRYFLAFWLELLWLFFFLMQTHKCDAFLLPRSHRLTSSSGLFS